MYFSRTNSLLDFLLYLLLCLIFSTGGWLVMRHTFRLPARERLITGIAAGWLAFIAVANILAHYLPLTLSYWLASLLVLSAGVFAAWQAAGKASLPAWFEREDLRAWPQLAALIGMTGFLLAIQRGLAIFDDYVHMPLTSTVGAGDVPPHFYVDPAVYFAYHYGLHLSAGALERVAGFFPWSAWDLSKAFAIALTLSLGWLWVLRLTNSRPAAWLGTFLITFGGGARWLLLLAPGSILDRISAQVTMINTGLDTAKTLEQALILPWRSNGGAPIPFPFAFHNGIFVPVHFVLGSNGALPFVGVLVLLMLAYRRRFNMLGAAFITAAMAVLALSGEHVFVFLWGGIGLAVGLYVVLQLARRSKVDWRLALAWGGILAASMLIALLQGAYLTETGRSVLAQLQGTPLADSNNTYGFSLRWPPAIPSAHTAPLSIFNLGQLAALLAELGPALLLFPVVTWYAWERTRRKDWMKAGLGLGMAVSFLFALFFQYGSDRSTTRLAATSLWSWLVLGFPILWMLARKGGMFTRFLIGAGYTVTVFAGTIIFAIQVTAIQTPQLSYFLFPQDAQVARLYWDKLEKNAQILDSLPERAVTVFGRASRARPWFYEPYPDFTALVASPDPVKVAQAGYSYIYMNSQWWDKLDDAQRNALKQPCVKVLYDNKAKGNDLRRLYDVKQCK